MLKSTPGRCAAIVVFKPEWCSGWRSPSAPPPWGPTPQSRPQSRRTPWRRPHEHCSWWTAEERGHNGWDGEEGGEVCTFRTYQGRGTGTYSDGRLLCVAELVDSLLKGQACFCQNNTLESRAKHNTKFSRPASTKTWRHYRLSKTLEALSRAQPKTWYTISKQCVYTSQAAHENTFTVFDFDLNNNLINDWEVLWSPALTWYFLRKLRSELSSRVEEDFSTWT